MPSLRYLHLDVFTSTPFEGNQLAVFPEPGDLSTAQMQTIAREMNFSESTFIYPRERDGDVKMRIFTPGEELPMAGHPTIGSTFALAIEGTIAAGRKDWLFELGAGPTPVSLEWTNGRLSFAWMTQLNPEFGGIVSDRAVFAATIGVDEAALSRDAPIQVVSCAVPYLIVPMTSRAAVDAVSFERKAMARVCAAAGLDEVPVYFFTLDRPSGSAEQVYSRMLGPGLGIAEDPATGSAAGPLGCYLLQHRLLTPAESQAVENLQGAAMGRPSRIHISIDGQPDHITRVRVGGQAVLVGRGEITT